MFEINDKLSLGDIAAILKNHSQLKLSKSAKEKILNARIYLDKKLTHDNTTPIYGINTGFGALYNKRVPDEQLAELQYNVLRSHACGTGEEVPADVVKLMLLLKIQGLSYGHSGVQVATVQRLIDFYNNDILPVIYQQGSLGASGDLAPLAHLSLPLIGEGEVRLNSSKFKVQSSKKNPQLQTPNPKLQTASVLRQFNWQPLQLQSKEGIALLNGTQFMSAYGVKILLEANDLLSKANLISALSLEAYDGRPEPFHALIHKSRPHGGQSSVAENIRTILKDSQLIKRKKQHVQDPYSLRCIPQVHGASADAIHYMGMVLETEIQSVTDNPLIFPEQDVILSGGNFHGQPLALALDLAAIALAELGSISERRTYLLLSGQRGLPPFLVPGAEESGINSGLMIAQYTAASIVSQNKQLCTPASVDSIVSSNGQEDHVSMGANAATKAYQVGENLKTILAIELLTAAQALEFRRPAKSSQVIEKLISDFRKEVPFLKHDRFLHDDIMKSRKFLFE